jgi:hypothetical protein
MDLSDIDEPYPHRCVSVGFLHSENEHAKILLPTIADLDHGENQHAFGGIKIPCSAILSEKRLK